MPSRKENKHLKIIKQIFAEKELLGHDSGSAQTAISNTLDNNQLRDV